jgi:hypothetical protein
LDFYARPESYPLTKGQLFVAPSDTWENLEAYCKANGGHLVSIHSAAEDATVKAFMLAETSSSYPYIGGFTTTCNKGCGGDSMTQFEWTDGTPWDYEHTGTFSLNDNAPTYVHLYRAGHWGTHNAAQQGICRRTPYEYANVGYGECITATGGAATKITPSGGFTGAFANEGRLQECKDLCDSMATCTGVNSPHRSNEGCAIYTQDGIVEGNQHAFFGRTADLMLQEEGYHAPHDLAQPANLVAHRRKLPPPEQRHETSNVRKDRAHR